MFSLKSFPPYPEKTPTLTMMALPADLPEPVARYYRVTCGDPLPVIHSAVITGRASMRIGGLTFPARFRFTHEAGRHYRHYIEAAVLGIPVMKVNEQYLDGHSRLELPFGTIENELKMDEAANLGLWAESIWLPSILLSDPRVRWQTVDATTAGLVVLFGQEEERFTVTFDPESGRLLALETWRYREAKDKEKIPWRNEVLGWQTFHGIQIPSPGSATWLDQGRPWAVFTVEDVAYNVDVSEYVRGRGL
jgi:hypothetical protein